MSERGAAARRRERRLRAWHRHERLTVAMELATALHHSAQRPRPVVEEPKEGWRARCTTRYGDRSLHPRGLGGRLSRRQPCCTVLALGHLASRGMACRRWRRRLWRMRRHASTLSFLTRAALEEKRKEEEAMVEQQKAKDTDELALLQEAEGRGWVQVVDESSGRTYYYNPRTRASR